MDKEAAIKKTKLLLKLSQSPNEHEANNAQEKANQLIAEFSLTPEDYEEKVAPPVYTEDDLLFCSTDPHEWRRDLAVISTNKFDCYVIEEVNTVIATNENIYRYYAYGHANDMLLSKHLFDLLVKEATTLIDLKCKGKNELFTSSYCEGMVNGIRINVEHEDYVVAGLTKQEAQAEDKPALTKTEAPKKEKPFSTKQEANVHLHEKPLDIQAYFQGENDAYNNIHIGSFSEEKYLDEVDDNGFFLEARIPDPDEYE
jgi:hypothetical protein